MNKTLKASENRQSGRLMRIISVGLFTLLLIIMVAFQSSIAFAASVKAPAMKSVSAKSSSSITVKWKKASKVKGYVIYQKEGSGKYKKIATLSSGSKVTYTKKELKSATKYSYKVKAYKTKDGKKTYSGFSKAKSTYTKPATPTNVKASVKSDTSIKVSWGKVAKAKGYTIYAKSDGEYEKIATVKSGKKTSFIVSGLNSGTGYTFAIKAYFTPKDKKIYSAMSKSKSATTSESGTKEQDNSMSETVVWIPTRGGTKYHSNAECSNMIEPQNVKKSEAIDLGFSPCGRCY